MFRFRLLPFCILAMCAAAYLVRVEGAQTKSPAADTERVRTGIDVLEEEHFATLRGKRVGLITNQTGVDAIGRRTIDMLAHAEGVKLTVLFSPEHGIAGRADGAVGPGADGATGLPIYSLYGETRRPTDAMLKGLDVLVFDIQDAGVRFYTYVTTMAYSMEESAKHHIGFVVLDRPDPLTGEVIEGPMLDRERLSFTGYFPMPVRYGMTMGELAQMFNRENKIGADLHVLAMKNWRRSQTYDQTGLKWIPPSPNLRTIDEAFLYPGIEILQAGGVSVGRGTDTPFEIVGAPWVNGPEFAADLSGRKIPGVQFTPTLFTPRDGLYKNNYCQGISVAITDRAELRAMRIGLEIAAALHRLYPKQFHLEKTVELLGAKDTIERLERGEDPARIIECWQDDLAKFRAMRKKYLLYD